MLARVRWTNVAAALAAVAILGLVVAWPLLEPEPPPLPEGPPRTSFEAAPTVTPPPVEADPRPLRRPRRRPAKEDPSAFERHARPRPRRPQPRPAKPDPPPLATATAVPRASPPPSPPAYVPPPTSPPGGEFGGFEQ